MRKLLRHTSRTVRLLSYVIIGLVGALGVLIVTRASITTPDIVWLPEADTIADESLYYSLPVASKRIVTKYGAATVFSSTNKQSDGQTSTPVTKIYEFSSNVQLNEADCPNIMNIESVLPSPCDKLGTHQGQPIYAISRRLPSMMVEYFVRLDGAFIYIQAGVDSQPTAKRVQTLQPTSSSQANDRLKANQQRLDRLYAKERAATAAQKTQDDSAYERLDFTPALPKDLPAGWKLNDLTGSNPFTIEGPNNQHPSLVTAEYVKGKKQFVTVHAGRLSDYTLGPLCGPTPGSGMEHLGCVKPIGKNYYEAARILEAGDLVRTLYYVVGDSLVITQIQLVSNDGKPVTWPTELAEAQDAITLSAQPINKSMLAGSSYRNTYY